jgi:hypothetical protein
MCSDFGVASLISCSRRAPPDHIPYTRTHPRAPNLHQTNLLRGIATREPMRLATQSVIVPMRMHCGPREKILDGDRGRLAQHATYAA